MLSITANAELWLIGALSPDSWVTNKGVQFTAVDANNYTLDLNVTKTGQQYFSLTTKLASAANDWDGIKAYRFGGKDLEVKLNTETTLEAGVDDSPFINIPKTGTYKFEFNTSTHKLKVTMQEETPAQTFNGTIYIDKASIGNIWAWDTQGNYFDAWPGKAINTLDKETVNGNEFYKFTYSHNSTNPGLIFNEGEGQAQTTDLVPQDGKLYKYTGGTTVTITDVPEEPAKNELYLIGSFNDWDQETKVPMTLGNDGKFTVSQEMEAGAEFKLMDQDGNWIGAVSEGNFIVTKEQVEEGTELSLLSGDAGQNFQIPVAGTWTLTADKENMKLVIAGEWVEPEVPNELYLIGSFNEWSEETKVAMTLGEDGKFTVSQEMEAGAEFKLMDQDGNWIGAVSEGNFIVTKEQVEEGTELSLLSGDAGQNFQIPVAGTWTLTADKENMKLI
ncbi:MAG: starch-binding protein, partial [Muribaculaceae bacterium]|nr:starch-binding protein [Muribaculaceae bacterium]